MRTTAELFTAESCLSAQVSLPGEGSMDLDVGVVPESLTGRFRGITDFLVCGLALINAEAPEDLQLRVTQEEQGGKNPRTE